MTTIPVASDESDPRKIAFALRQVQEGRNNATGFITLKTSTTLTKVVAVNCSQSSSIALTPASAAGGVEFATGNCYVTSTKITNGSFTITHSNTTTAGRSFWWMALG